MADGRLTLRPLRVDDADRLFDRLCDLALYEHLDEDPPASVTSLRDRFAALVRGAPDGVHETWLNRVIEIDELPVGTVQATIFADRPTSIAYVVFVDQQGRGVARRAISAWLDTLRDHHEVSEVQVEIDPANVASLAVARACGFEPVGPIGADVCLRRRLA